MKINRIGKVGDIYTDPESGKTYKCVYAYKDSTGSVDCDWKEIESVVSNTIDTKPEIVSEKIPEGKNPEKHSERSSDSMNKVNVDDVIEKQFGNNPRPNKTKYTNYSKK